MQYRFAVNSGTLSTYLLTHILSVPKFTANLYKFAVYEADEVQKEVLSGHSVYKVFVKYTALPSS